MRERDKSVEAFVCDLTDEQLAKEIDYTISDIEDMEEENSSEPEELRNKRDLIKYLRFLKVHLDIRKWRRGELDRATVVINAEYDEKIKQIPPFKRVKRPKTFGT